MNNKDNTKIIKLSEQNSCEVMCLDTRMFFENGRIYISEYPTIDGKQSDFAERIDVTEKVAKAIIPYITNNK